MARLWDTSSVHTLIHEIALWLLDLNLSFLTPKIFSQYPECSLFILGLALSWRRLVCFSIGGFSTGGFSAGGQMAEWLGNGY